MNLPPATPSPSIASKKRELPETSVNATVKKTKVGGKAAAVGSAISPLTTTKMDVKAKLERSRQSARECRARKKLRYQYLEELVSKREEAIFVLKEELDSIKDVCSKIDSGILPLDAANMILEDKIPIKITTSSSSSGRTSTVTK